MDNTLRKAAEMGLEALEFAASEIYNEHNDDVIADAIKALRQALAQPEQQWGDSEISKPEVVEAQRRANNAVRALVDACDEHVAKVVFPQPEQEPVTWEKNYDIACSLLRQAHDILATTQYPIKRPWVSLTDEELNDVAEESEFGYTNLARAIEAKLKEKNT